MAETIAIPTPPKTKRLRLNWLLEVLLYPRETFSQIASHSGSTWLTPLLLLSITTLLTVWASGTIRQAAAASGQIELPPEFQYYYTPEQQAQYMQAMQATSGPVFIYVFPALINLSKVWFGWLLVSSLLHLVFTLLGGRGNAGVTLNLMAWAGVPFALRDLVRFVAMMNNDKLIQTPGLMGFAPLEEGITFLFLAGLMASIDLYLIWHIALLTIGGQAANGLSGRKVFAAVLVSILLVISIQALIGVGVQQLGSLTIIRPFF